jgi:hypothetical protein
MVTTRVKPRGPFVHASMHVHTHVFLLTFRRELQPRWWLLSGLDSVAVVRLTYAIESRVGLPEHRQRMPGAAWCSD